MNESLTLQGPNLPTLTVTKDNAVAELGGWDATIPRGLMAYGLCPIPLFSDLSIELYGLYAALDGTSRLRTPEEIYGLPSLYLDAVNIINAERGRHGNQQ